MPLAKERTYNNNLLLGVLTAFTAGATNISGAMACYLFTANITGHAAGFSQHVLAGRWLEMLLALAALAMFFGGSFTASFIIQTFAYKGNYKAFAIPFVVEILVLAAIACWGMYGNDNIPLHTEMVAGALLFCMGLQNSSVTAITGTVKSSHLTGLITDLGNETAQWVKATDVVKKGNLSKNLHLRFSILGAYITGGIAGGIAFVEFDYGAFLCIAAIILILLIIDLTMKDQ